MATETVNVDIRDVFIWMQDDSQFKKTPDYVYFLFSCILSRRSIEKCALVDTIVNKITGGAETHNLLQINNAWFEEVCTEAEKTINTWKAAK